MITFGKILCKEKFKPLTRERHSHRFLNKPSGGIWGSPVSSEWGWKDWCESEGFNLGTFGVYTKWKVRPGKKILVIDSGEDLAQSMDLYGEYKGYFWNLNFWRILRAGYAGMMLTRKGNRECHCGIEYRDTQIDLNSWDCESIVVWDWKAINITEKGRIYEKNRH